MMTTRETLFHNIPEKGASSVSGSFAKHALRNTPMERMANIAEAPKAMKPMPGFLSVPVP
jgi:hypothetical protein